jgi:AbrB family looped-hinge helix DNA binding protein
MKGTTRIDSAGRLVIPKELRVRFGLGPGQTVRIVARDDGIVIAADRPARRFVRRGPILTIDTGAGSATLEDFEVDAVRESSLEDKSGADRR